MTEQQTTPAPVQPPPPASTPTPPAGDPKPGPPPAAADKQPPWGAPENFNADEAWKTIQNLRKEKTGGDPALKAQLDQMRADQTKQRDALALALGVKPEETSDADKLASQIDSLRGQILASEKRALAAEFKVPETLLTATDADGMRAQAQALVEFAEGAHYAASTASAQTPPPAFQQNPGQGQGGTPPSAEALEQAEYEKYFPPTTAQR